MIPTQDHYNPSNSTLSSIINDITQWQAIDQSGQCELQFDLWQRQWVASKSTVNCQPIVQQQHLSGAPSPDLCSPLYSTLTPTTPTPTTPHINDNMHEHIPFFHGDGHPGKVPYDFLKWIQQYFQCFTFPNDTTRINTLALTLPPTQLLKSGSKIIPHLLTKQHGTT